MPQAFIIFNNYQYEILAKIPGIIQSKSSKESSEEWDTVARRHPSLASLDEVETPLPTGDLIASSRPPTADVGHGEPCQEGSYESYAHVHQMVPGSLLSLYEPISASFTSPNDSFFDLELREN